MRKRQFEMRTFRCPKCKGVIKAAKRKNRLTAKGHIKTMWCPWCKEERDFEQVGEWEE